MNFLFLRKCLNSLSLSLSLFLFFFAIYLSYIPHPFPFFSFSILKTIMNDCLQFDQGIMRLSAFDPLSNQYETRILTLPELPLLESLEHLFDNSRPALRMSKSCSNKKTVVTRRSSIILNNTTSLPRRCQSNPNLTKKQQKKIGKKKYREISDKTCHSFVYYVVGGGPMRPKRSLSGAFNAVAGFIQKATNKKLRSTTTWSRDTWIDEIRLSSSSISSLSSPQPVPLNSSCENWWMSSPPISSF